MVWLDYICGLIGCFHIRYDLSQWEFWWHLVLFERVDLMPTKSKMLSSELHSLPFVTRWKADLVPATVFRFVTFNEQMPKSANKGSRNQTVPIALIHIVCFNGCCGRRKPRPTNGSGSLPPFQDNDEHFTFHNEKKSSSPLDSRRSSYVFFLTKHHRVHSQLSHISVELHQHCINTVSAGWNKNTSPTQIE